MRWLFLLLVFCCSANGQEVSFPQKNSNIEITVLFPAGSSADITARVLAEGMGRQLGVNVLVVNRPGAGGAVGYKHAASQRPDGYALVWNSNSISTTYHSGQLAFDYKAFDPVARVWSSPASRGAAAPNGDLARSSPRQAPPARSRVELRTGSHTTFRP